MAAVKSKSVAFIVLMSGPALTGEKVMLAQAELIAAAERVLLVPSRGDRRSLSALRTLRRLPANANLPVVVAETTIEDAKKRGATGRTSRSLVLMTSTSAWPTSVSAVTPRAPMRQVVRLSGSRRATTLAPSWTYKLSLLKRVIRVSSNGTPRLPAMLFASALFELPLKKRTSPGSIKGWVGMVNLMSNA